MGSGLRHGRSICDIRFAKVDHATESAIQSDGGLRSADHLATTIRNHDKKVLKRKLAAAKTLNEKLKKAGKAPKDIKILSKDGFHTEILGPFVHHLPMDKPPKRTVFTFAGIQSSKGVTHDRETALVYNNVYPDVPRTAGLVFCLVHCCMRHVEVIPKSLIKEEDRPKSQLKTKRHKRKAPDEIGAGAKKLKRQRKRWAEQEKRGEIPKQWTPKEKRGPYKKPSIN